MRVLDAFFSVFTSQDALWRHTLVGILFGFYIAVVLYQKPFNCFSGVPRRDVQSLAELAALVETFRASYFDLTVVARFQLFTELFCNLIGSCDIS